MRRWLLLGSCLAAGMAGCTRDWYRRDADKESFSAISERMQPAWHVPTLDITPPPQSRLYDPYSPDFPPLPPDDPFAHQYMRKANGIPGYKGWYKDGVAPSVEDPGWRAFVTVENDGSVLLNRDRAVALSLIHSREYQDELEDLYLVALALTLNRYEFDLQWFLTNNTTYQHLGTSSVPTESNTLTTNTNFGFNRSLATGGQLLVNFANSFVWEYTGKDSNIVSSGLAFTLVQPLLRGAGREVRMEALTQGERNLLYALRDFARFRKQFYLNVTTGGDSFLSLLLQVQNIRNQEANLQALEQNLRLHEALFVSGEVSVVQVDQTYQSYQQGKATLIQARTNLENAFDSYKIRLGLPPSIPIKLDDALLEPFQLNSKEINDLQEDLDKLLAGYREMNQAPPLPKLEEGYTRLKRLYQTVVGTNRSVRQEYAELMRQQQLVPPPDEETRRDRAALEQLAKQLAEIDLELPKLLSYLDKDVAELAEKTRTQDWERLQRRIRDVISQVSQLFVIQTQIRVSRLDLPPVAYKEAEAVSQALGNRLDLMNERGRVVDAWRRIKVAADALEGVANVTVGGNVNTAPEAGNPFDFSALTSSYRVGVQLEGPLNRLAERNAYRASLISYQRARRTYMSREDGIVQAIRRDLRQLETDRLNFALARRSLISAARQVEAARERLLIGGAGNAATGTLDILNALNALLQAKNALISFWINYETGRLQLLLDMEQLQLDERGIYRDDASRQPDAPPPPGNERFDFQP